MRSLVHLPVWLLGVLLVVVIPLLVVALQAFVRRRWPLIVEGQHNDVAGFFIAVVGVLYAVTLAFIVIVTWEEFRGARETVDHEAGALRGVLRDSRGLPEPTGTEMGRLVVRYADEVSGPEWEAMDTGESSRRAFDLVGEMFTTLERVTLSRPAEQPFLADALERLDEVVQQRAKRLSAAEEGAPSVLWVAIIVGGVLTVGFALLFGVSNERLHYLMIGGFTAIIALQVFVILVLNFPYSGSVRVVPHPFEQIVADFG